MGKEGFQLAGSTLRGLDARDLNSASSFSSSDWEGRKTKLPDIQVHIVLFVLVTSPLPKPIVLSRDGQGEWAQGYGKGGGSSACPLKL